MSGGTISTSTNKVEALRLQSSAQGVTIPWLRGTNKIAGNLVWYDGFKAIAKTETSGGKGGTSVSNTTWTYQVDAIMGICHGPILDIPRVWRGKMLYDGGISPGIIQKASEDFAVPASGPMDYTLANAATYRNVISVTAVGGEYWGAPLASGYDFVISAAGVLTILDESYRGTTVWVSYQYTVGVENRSALQEIGMTFGRGSIGQAVWSGLASYAPSAQIGYSGLAYVAGQAYSLGETAQLENHTFEVVGPLAYHLDSATPDVDMSLAIRELLLDSRAGAGFPSANSASWQAWSDFCVAANILGSPLLTEQQTMADVLVMAAKATITAIVWSDGLLKMIPYSDAEEAGRGRTFTPDVEPKYDLDNDTYLIDGVEAPVRYRHKPPTERFNHFRIEYRDRSADYAPAIAFAQDLADIEESGLRSADVIKMDWVCDGAVARKIAQLLLQRSLSVRTEYECTLPWHFALLEPADIVTLTDTLLELDREPVRIIAIEEGEEGDLELVLEDYPIGAAAAAEYDHEYPDGYIPNYNVKPGPAQPPLVFEAPVELTTTGLELMIAVAGSSPNWGGANVWMSIDGSGTNYKLVGTVDSPAKYGTLRSTTAAGAATIEIELNTDSELRSGAANDALTLQTLIYMGGSAPEFAAYEVATLVGVGQYDLSGTLVRGANSTGAQAHAAGDAFVRVDDAVVRSGSLDLSLIGQEVWIKITSFNIYRGAEESLAEVDEYRYTITGYMAKLPPSMPTGDTYAIEEFGVRLICAKNPEPDVIGYEWRAGPVLATSEVLEEAGGTSYPWRVQLAGAFTAWVAAVDRFGNKSAYAQIDGTVPGATITVTSVSFSGPDLVIEYFATPGAFNVARVEARYGASFASATVAPGATLTRFQRKADWLGLRDWWLVAVDVAGNYGTQVNIDVTISAPSAPLNQRADVVDNNVLLYWDKPATGSLPIARYDIKKGATLGGAVLIGSNADSTFTVVFEQLAGNFKYWIIPYDTAGNAGAAASLSATVNQPPDYILRVDWLSTFSGTKTNMFIEDGALIGPVNTSESWTGHFTAGGWAAPSDQVAAGLPLYIEPSVASGSYDETFDYGATLPATTVNVTLTFDAVDGTVTRSCQIYHKLLAGDPWTAAPAGDSALINNFRYVRVLWTFTTTPGANILRVNSMRVKLSAKQRTDSGEGTITNATTGKAVTFGYPFIDCDTPIMQGKGAVPRIAVVDFTDVPNPTGFTAYLYDINGNKVTGDFSWTVRGY